VPWLLLWLLPQYNTCYWCLVKAGKFPAEAQAIIKVCAGHSAMLQGLQLALFAQLAGYACSCAWHW
jgi:hypothetical protein